MIKQFFRCLFGKHEEGKRELKIYYPSFNRFAVGYFSICKHCGHETILSEDLTRTMIYERALSNMTEGQKKNRSKNNEN
jgi:hypothetical protein